MNGAKNSASVWGRSARAVVPLARPVNVAGIDATPSPTEAPPPHPDDIVPPPPWPGQMDAKFMPPIYSGRPIAVTAVGVIHNLAGLAFVNSVAASGRAASQPPPWPAPAALGLIGAAGAIPQFPASPTKAKNKVPPPPWPDQARAALILPAHLWRSNADAGAAFAPEASAFVARGGAAPTVNARAPLTDGGGAAAAVVTNSDTDANITFRLKDCPSGSLVHCILADGTVRKHGHIGAGPFSCQDATRPECTVVHLSPAHVCHKRRTQWSAGTTTTTTTTTTTATTTTTTPPNVADTAIGTATAAAVHDTVYAAVVAVADGDDAATVAVYVNCCGSVCVSHDLVAAAADTNVAGRMPRSAVHTGLLPEHIPAHHPPPLVTPTLLPPSPTHI